MERTNIEPEADADHAVRNTNNLLVSGPTNVPRIVKFAYKDFTVKGERWRAACKKCNKCIQDKINVTSAFTK
jgi:hypothetical protein